MFKEYKFTIFAVIIFGIIIAFGLKGAAKQQDTTVERLEIPLPFKNTSEQILYRKGYTVSYNKDNKIPNWVAWHLTAEHATGPYRRPSGAWHEDTDVPAPRATFADYRDCAWSRGHSVLQVITSGTRMPCTTPFYSPTAAHKMPISTVVTGTR